jgi:hypothetical protein
MTVDLIANVAPALDKTALYKVFAALSRLVPSIHGNLAVGLIAEQEGAILRIRLFQGTRPNRFKDRMGEWRPMRVADFEPLMHAPFDVDWVPHSIGSIHVRQLQPCMVLGGVIAQRHGKHNTEEQTERRLRVGGVMCKVTRVGAPYLIQTGRHSGDASLATPIRVDVKDMSSGVAAQTMPLGSSGRYGGGFLVPMESEPIAFDVPSTMSTVKASKALGVDRNTIQRQLKKAGYDRLTIGATYMDPSMVRRIEEQSRFVRMRKEHFSAGHRWTYDQKSTVWQWIQDKITIEDAARLVGRTTNAVEIMAIRMRRETGGF